MMTKKDVLAELDDCIRRFERRRSSSRQQLPLALQWLNADLDDLFDGKDAPTAFIESVKLLPDGRFQLEVSSFAAANERDEWLACFQDYVGDRFVVEPYKPTLTFSFPLDLRCENFGIDPMVDLCDPLPPSLWLDYVNLYGTTVRAGAIADKQFTSANLGASLRARAYENRPLNAETMVAAMKKARDALATAAPTLEPGMLVGASNPEAWEQAVKLAPSLGLTVSPKPFFAPYPPDKKA